MRRAYDYRRRRLSALADDGDDGDEEDYEDRSLAYQRMVVLVLEAQRDQLVRLRNSGEISNEVMLRVIHDFDLEE